MARTRKRSSTSVIVPSTALEQATTTLQELPEKPRETYSLREAIALLQEPISLALGRGYSYDEVRAILSENGIDIAPSSLRRYLSLTKPKRTAAPPKATKGRKMRGKAAQVTEEGEEQPISEAEVEAVAVEMGEQAPAEAAQKGKAPSRRRARAESAEEGAETKVAAKAKPKAATRAKPSTRSTSTRRRRASKNP